MSWFDKFFRHNDESSIERTEVPFSTILRWALYDLSIEDPNEIAVILGLNPVSEEGNNKEVEDSELRLSYLDDLIPYIDIISELNAKIVVATQVRDLPTWDGPPPSEEEIEMMGSFYKAVGFSALVTAFSSGIQLDILHTHAIGTGTGYREEDDE